MHHANNDPAVVADIEIFERLLADHLASPVEADALRVFRLDNGVYGQRKADTTNWFA